MNYIVGFWRDDYERLFNCSAYTFDEWKSFGTPNALVGTFYLVMGFTYEIIYLPFLFIMVKSEFLKLSCYKLMFLLGLIDVTCISLGSICYGMLAFKGAVFCMYPTFIFCVGAAALSMWCGACCTCTILAINRSLDIVSPHHARMIFAGKKTLFVMLIPVFYIFYYFIFASPIIFNSLAYAGFFDPYIGTPLAGNDIDINYPHVVHSINNVVVIFVIIGAYGFLCVALTIQYRGAESVRLSKMQRQTFIQSSIICTFITIAALIYVWMQFLPTPTWVVVMGQIVWQSAHGSTGIIYMTLNPTMRREAFKLYLYPFRRATGRGTVGTSNSIKVPQVTNTHSSQY
uniref:Serpentine Receptor, class T n=1 Tax=Panagrellus redivivus TaxID=6233 RepID=A0A7E4UNA2_PANRE